MKRVQFTRFSQLDADAVNRDLQVHTVETDGAGTVAEYLKVARELKLGEIAFTDHIRRSSTYFPKFADHVRREREKTPDISVLLGFEAKAADEDGTLDAPEIAIQQADIRLGSVHRFPDALGGLVKADQFDYGEAADIEYRLALGIVRFAPIDVLAHPGGMCLRAYGRFPDDKMIGLMRATLDRGIAIEINTSYTIDMDHFLTLCADVDPIVSIGSDAHKLSELGTCRNALRERGIG